MSLRQLSEAEVWSMAGDVDCPVIAKAESAPMEAAVCLKELPTGYVLGLSDNVNGIEFWYTTDLDQAKKAYSKSLQLMQTTGSALIASDQ